MQCEGDGQCTETAHKSLSHASLLKRVRDESVQNASFTPEIDDHTEELKQKKLVHIPARYFSAPRRSKRWRKYSSTDVFQFPSDIHNERVHENTCAWAENENDRFSLPSLLATSSTNRLTVHHTALPSHLVHIKLICGDVGKHITLTIRIVIKFIMEYHLDRSGSRPVDLFHYRTLTETDCPLMSVHEKVRMEVIHNHCMINSCSKYTNANCAESNCYQHDYLKMALASTNAIRKEAAIRDHPRVLQSCAPSTYLFSRSSDIEHSTEVNNCTSCTCILCSLHLQSTSKDTESMYSYFYELSQMSLRDNVQWNFKQEYIYTSDDLIEDSTRAMIFDCFMKCALDELSLDDVGGWVVLYRGHNMRLFAERMRFVNDLLDKNVPNKCLSLFFFRKC